MAATKQQKAWARRPVKMAKPARRGKPGVGDLTKEERAQQAKVMRSILATRALLAAQGVTITHEEIKRILNSD